MREAIVLDSHAWKMLVDGDPIARRTLRRIDAAAAAGTLHIAAITVWEIAMLVSKGLLKIGSPTLQWIADAVHASHVIVFPLEPSVAVDAAELPVFHGDPADRMIVATARHLRAVLVTRDDGILEWAGASKSVRVLEP